MSTAPKEGVIIGTESCRVRHATEIRQRSTLCATRGTGGAVMLAWLYQLEFAPFFPLGILRRLRRHESACGRFHLASDYTALSCPGITRRWNALLKSAIRIDPGFSPEFTDRNWPLFFVWCFQGPSGVPKKWRPPPQLSIVGYLAARGGRCS